MITKATPHFSATLQTSPSLKVVFEVNIGYQRATGTITVQEQGSPRGSTLVDTQYGTTTTYTIPIDPLPPGRHELRITYSGDANVEGAATTAVFVIPGIPPPPKRRAAGH